MSQLHKINQTCLELDFTAVADADAFEPQAARWVAQHLMPMVKSVFDDVCPDDRTLVIDTLTLDLGVFTSKTFYQQAPERLKERLRNELRALLHQATQPQAAPSGIQLLSQQQRRWNLLWHFLRTGTLPWTHSGERSLAALGLSEMLTEHGAKFIHALNGASQPEPLIRRVVEQFPARQLAELFPSLTPAHRWQMMTLLLAHPARRTDELSGQLAQAWFDRLTQLLAQHNLAPLRAHWEMLVHQFAPQLVKAIWQRHADGQLPWYLVRDLTDIERLLLLRALTPLEYPFLSAVLRTPDWWQMQAPGDTAQILPPSRIHQQLWLFTLQFLIVDRGSVFNRQRYMSGLVVQMANAQNQSVETLLASLIAALNSTTFDSTLRGQLLDLLQRIQPTLTAAPSVKPQAFDDNAPDNTQLVTPLVLALSSGDEKQLLRHWPEDAAYFAGLLRWCGQLASVRRLWSERFSDKTLFALVGVLEPQASPLVRLFARQSVPSDVWEYTLAFLIVERDSAFTPKGYLQYVMQQMAARSDVTAGPAHRPPAISLHLLSSLSSAQLAGIAEIIATLQQASQVQWNSHITRWQAEYAQQLPQIIRETGRSMAVIRRWVAHFDDVTLLTLTTLVTPLAREATQSVIAEKQTLSAVVSHAADPINSTPIRNALWELTLHYLISRRGSEFNHYQYLMSVTEQLSARYRIGVEILIREWLNLSDSGFLWRRQLNELIERRRQPPATAPQLLADIQSGESEPALSEQALARLQHYAAINASALANQLQSWKLPQLTRLVRIVQPQLSERVIALLPLLLDIVQQFALPLHAFYSLLFSRECPATPEQWLTRLLRHISRPGAAHYHQLQQRVLGSNAIRHSATERKRWLASLLPEARLHDALCQWLEGNAPAPDRDLLRGLSQRSPSLCEWLRRALGTPRAMQRWLDAVSPDMHQALLFPTLTSHTLNLLALRQAFCPLFDAPQRGEYLFWQTLYRQHWLKGIAMSGCQLLRAVLSELNQLWLAQGGQNTGSGETSVAGLIAQLLPRLTSTCQRKTFIQLACQYAPRPTGNAAWLAQLDRKQPEIKQLIEAINMPDKDENPHAGIPWEHPQDADASTEPVTIHNAGLVIASTFIPMLFQRLGLTNGQQFVSDQARHQALFCLQWMSHRTQSAPEYQLLLNKVLCGIAPSSPVPQSVELPEGAETLIDGLLTALIAHWKALGNTSVSGLQTTFIQREGLLSFTPEHGQLNVLPAPFDMLLDQLPWSFKTIKYPWMDKPLFVSWR